MLSASTPKTKTYDSNSYVSFCNIRLNPKELETISKNNKGLKKSDKINDALHAGNYISVVKAVWGECDSKKRLQWLREKKDFLHAPLMYELGIAEFEANSTIETINRTTLPLFKAANFRIQQDAVCVDDPLARRCAESLEIIYAQALDALAQEKLNKSLLEILDDDIETRNTSIINKLKKIARRSLKLTSFPNPKWVAYSSEQISQKQIKMHPEDRWSALRNTFANSTLKQLQQ